MDTSEIHILLITLSYYRSAWSNFELTCVLLRTAADDSYGHSSRLHPPLAQVF